MKKIFYEKVLPDQEVLKHGQDEFESLFIETRDGYLRPKKISLDCQIKKSRGNRGKRDRRIYFLKKVPGSEQFRILYPSTIRNSRQYRNLQARKNIAKAICDSRKGLKLANE